MCGYDFEFINLKHCELGQGSMKYVSVTMISFFGLICQLITQQI